MSNASLQGGMFDGPASAAGSTVSDTRSRQPSNPPTMRSGSQIGSQRGSVAGARRPLIEMPRNLDLGPDAFALNSGVSRPFPPTLGTALPHRPFRFAMILLFLVCVHANGRGFVETNALDTWRAHQDHGKVPASRFIQAVQSLLSMPTLAPAYLLSLLCLSLAF